MSKNYIVSELDHTLRPQKIDCEYLQSSVPSDSYYWTVAVCERNGFEESYIEESKCLNGVYYHPLNFHFTFYIATELCASSLVHWTRDPYFLMNTYSYYPFRELADNQHFISKCNCRNFMVLEFQAKDHFSLLLSKDGENQLRSLIKSRERRNADVSDLINLVGKLHLKQVRDCLSEKKYPEIEFSEEKVFTKKEINKEMLKEGLVSDNALLSYNKFHAKKKKMKNRRYKANSKLRDIERTKSRDIEFQELNAAYFDFSANKIKRTYAHLETQSFKVLDGVADLVMTKLGSAKCIGPAIIFSLQLYRSTSWEDVLLAIAAFKFGASELVSTFSSYLDGIFDRLKDYCYSIIGNYTSQSWNSFLMRSLDGPLAGVCASLVSLCALGGVFPDKAYALSKFCVTSIKKPTNIRQLITYVSQLLGRFENFAHLIVNGASIQTLLLGNVEVGSIYHEYNILKRICSDDNLMYLGFPQANKYPYTDICRRLGKLLKEIDAYFDCNPGHDRISSMEGVKLDVQQWYAEVKNIVVTSTRDFPFVIVLHGHAGVGKSAVLDYLLECICNLYGIEWDTSLVYDRIRGVSFWEGYDPFSHPFIHYSEVGNESAALATKNGSPILDEINRLADNQKFGCDMAFQSKGKVRANPKVIAIDTNNKYMHMQSTMYCTAAIKRRCVFIELKPRKQFTAGDGQQIDFKKSIDHFNANDDCLLDRYNFIIETHIGKKKVESHKDLKSFTESFMRMYLEHLVRTPKIKDPNSRNLSKTIAQELLAGGIGVLDSDCNIIDSAVNKSISELNYRGGLGTYVLEPDADCDEKGEPDGEDPNLVTIQTEAGDGDEEYDSKEDEDHDLGCEEPYDPVLYQEPEEESQFFPEPPIPNLQWIKKDVPPATWWDWYFWFLHRLPNVFSLLCIMITVIFKLKIPFGFRLFFFFIIFIVLLVVILANLLPFLILFALSIFQEIKIGEFKVKKFLTSPLQHANLLTIRKVSMWFGNGKWLRKYFYGTAFVAVLLALNSVYRLIKKKPYDKVESQGIYYTNTIDEANNITDVTTRIQNKNNARWNNITNMYLGTYTGDIENFRRCVFNNIVRIRCDETQKTQYGLKIGGGYMIFNTHIFGSFHKFSLAVFKNDQVNGTLFFEKGDNCVEIGYDLCMVQYTSNSKDLLGKGHFSKSIVRQSFKANFTGHSVGAEYILIDPRSTIDGKQFDQAIDVYKVHMRTVRGQCGLPLMLHDGNKCMIVGVHFAGSDDSGYAIPVTASMLENGIKKLGSDLMRLSSEALEVKGEMPKNKSFVYYEDLHHITYYGHDGGPVLLNNKSNLRHTLFSKEITEILSTYLPQEDEKWVPALLKPRTYKGEYINPWNVGIRKICHEDRNIPMHNINKCIKIVSNRIIDVFKSNSVVDLSQVPMETAINGAAEDVYIRRINATTSPGYGYTGKKSDYLPFIDGNDTIREPCAEIQADMEKMINTYLEGNMAHPQYKAALKDELRHIEKALKGKTRLFYMSNLSHLIVSKIYLTKFFSNIVAYGDSVCTVVGIDMHRGAETIKGKINPSGDVTNFLEGDWGGFDVKTIAMIAHICASVIYKVHEFFGATERTLTILRGLLTDDIFPLINILGDMFETPGLTPSGKDRTAEYNGLKNLVLFVLAWLDSEYKDLDFFEHLHMVTYGDDVIVGNRDCPNFDNLYMERFAVSVGMEYTSAKKDGTLTPFVPFEELSFLKRSFVTLNNGLMLAPINHNTIYKALQWTAPSEFLLASDQVNCAMNSMMYEIFCYMPEEEAKFDTLRKQMIDTYASFYKVTPKHVPTFMECKNRMWGDSDWSEITEEKNDEVVHILTQAQSISNHRFLSITSTSISDCIVNCLDAKPQGYAEEVKNFEFELSRMTTQELLQLSEEYRNPLLCPMLRKDRKKRISDEIGGRSPQALVRKYTFQSAVSDALGEVKMMDTEENLQETARHIEVVPEGSFLDLGDNSKLSNNDVFERPVTIYNSNIQNSVYIFNIWSDYLSDPLVRSRLRNYAYAKCAYLEVTITVSGTPSDRGILMCSYQPYAEANDALKYIALNYSLYTDPKMYWCYLSQSKQVAYVDVKSCNTIEMRLPFICPKPMARLFNESSNDLSSAGDFDDFDELGDLYVTLLDGVSSAAGTTNASMHIRARMVGVSLACPTATRIDIATQSELEKGPVERISSAVAGVSGLLASHPVIGSYAKASQMVFGGLAALASHLGWSRPVLSELVHQVTVRHGTNETQTIGNSSALRVTLDPLQEVSVDGRACGDNDDDMVLQTMASRWSYYDMLEWAVADPPMTPIYEVPVTPQLIPSVADLTTTIYQPTAAAFTVAPFKWWRGKVVFRFMFETCAYDRGKLAFFFEPNVYQRTSIQANLGLNRNPIAILDLSVDSVIDICVDWAKERMWAKVGTTTEIDEIRAFDSTKADYINGFLMVCPITELQSPDLAPISVHCFMKCEELRVNAPQHYGLPSERLWTQSGTYDEVKCIDINECSMKGDKASVLMFGEEPISFRSLLKRYTTVRNSPVVTIVGDRSITARCATYPLPEPAFGDTSTYKPLFGYLRYAYLGMKGGTRRVASFVTDGQDGAMARSGALVDGTGTYVPGTPYTGTGLPWWHLRGTVTTCLHLNPNLEVEIPFSGNHLFWLSFNESPYGSSLTNFEPDSRLTFRVFCEIFNAKEAEYIEHFSTAEDFSFMRFQGAPLYSVSS